MLFTKRHCCGLWKIQNMLKIPSWNISEPDQALSEYLWGVRKIARTTFPTGASMPSQGGPSAKAARSVKFSRFRNFKCISTQTIFIICKVEIPKGDLRLASMTQVLKNNYHWIRRISRNLYFSSSSHLSLMENKQIGSTPIASLWGTGERDSICTKPWPRYAADQTQLERSPTLTHCDGRIRRRSPRE